MVLFKRSCIAWFCLVAGIAQADYQWDYIYVTCDPDRQRVTIQLESQNEDPDLGWPGQIRTDPKPAAQEFRASLQIDYGECFLTPNKKVRIKVSMGKAMPYGMCGADPEVWLSLWVDQRKWLSKRYVTGRCGTSAMSRAVVSPKGLTWCSRKKDPLSEPPADERETCKFVPQSRLPRSRDLAEYPVSATARPEAGSIVTEIGDDAPLCQMMVTRKSTKFGRAAWTVDFPSGAEVNLADAQDHGLYESSGHFSRNQFDIDNDDKKDVVYGFHPSNHAHDADIYFLSPGREIDQSWPNISEDMLWNGSYAFPHAFGHCPNGNCGKNDEDGLLPLKGYSEDGKPFAYRFRYLHVAPFVWRNATYFLLTSLDQGSEHISAVVKPRGRKTLDEICVFRTVLDNY